MPATKLKDIPLQDIEDAYAEGGTHTYVAEKIGLSNSHWSQLRAGRDLPKGVDISEISKAVKRGCSKAREKVQADLMNHSSKNVIASIFLAKQAHLLDYKDQRTVEQSGDIKVTVTHQVLPPVGTKEIDTQGDTQHTIDAEYTDITND